MSKSESEELNWWATSEKQAVKIVKPIQRIMGNWLLCRNKEGMEWFIPFYELQSRKEAPDA